MTQRIVGALVLAVLAIVLLPLILDMDGEYHVNTRSQIPPEPGLDEVPTAGPESIFSRPEPEKLPASAEKNTDDMFRYEQSREEAKKAADGVVGEPDELPGLTEEGIPKAWILQVASFTEREKAEAFSDQLLANSHKAYSRAVSVAGKTVYRVYVGPVVNKQDLLEEKAQIEKQYSVKTLLLRFEP